MLRQATQDLHEQAESGPFAKRLLAGEVSRDEWARFLQQAWHLHAAIEPLLVAAQDGTPELGEILRPHHFRLPHIEADLADLDSDPCETRFASVLAFISTLTQASSSDPLCLLGVLYVTEGATNGNRVLAKRLRARLGLSGTTATRYLDPHGDEQWTRWNTLKRGLDALNLDDEQASRCADAARTTFHVFIDLYAELANPTRVTD